VKGINPISAARHALGLGLAAQEFGSKFFSNGAHLSGVIQVPGEMTPEQARVIAQKWGRDHSGVKNAHIPGVLSGGAEWKPIAIAPDDAQFLQTRQFSAAEIAGQMFFVDPTLLGIAQSSTSLTYANLEQRGIHLTTFTLLPWIVRLERLFSALLPKAQFVKLNVGGLQRADMKTRYEAYAIGTGGAPFLTQNEPREKEDLPPLDATEFPGMSAAPTPGGPSGP
jgi:HK97 family phage portal protein